MTLYMKTLHGPKVCDDLNLGHIGGGGGVNVAGGSICSHIKTIIFAINFNILFLLVIFVMP